MKKNYFYILIFFLLLSSSSFASIRGIKITTSTGKDISLYTDYYALVIGNSNYDNWPDLPNAIKDAEDIAIMLKEFGFEVTLGTDLNSEEMIDALNNFTYKYGNINDRALIFYYAGHGETETLANNKMLGYIIPTDTPLIEKDPSGFTKKAISMTRVEDYSLKIQSKHVLMLFDSCFSGSIFSLGRAAPKNITEKVAYPVRQFITAGNENEIVPDESLFKTCLIKGLKDSFADLNNDDYITGKELGSYLQDNVINYTDGAQHPQFGTIRDPKLDRGDFIFALSSFRQYKIELNKITVENIRLATLNETISPTSELRESDISKVGYKKMIIIKYIGGSWIPIWFVPGDNSDDINFIITGLGFPELRDNMLFLNGVSCKGSIGKDWFIGCMGASYSKDRKIIDTTGVKRMRRVIGYGGLTLNKRIPLSGKLISGIGFMLGWGVHKLEFSTIGETYDWDNLNTQLTNSNNPYINMKRSYIMFQPQISCLYRINDWLGIRAEVGYILSYSYHSGWNAKICNDTFEIKNSPETSFGGLTISIGPWFEL